METNAQFECDGLTVACENLSSTMDHRFVTRFYLMFSLVSACKRLGVLACLAALPFVTRAQDRFASEGDEYPVIGSLQGDQVFAQAALNSFGGYLVWQDNATDGDGYGISARHINRSLSGSLGVFRINESGAGDQTIPQLAQMSNGGAVFVWQSAVGSSVRVYARFVNPDGTFATGDLPVSGYSGGDQTAPVVACLEDGTVVVVWSSLGQEQSANGQPVANGMSGVFAQRFSSSGEKIGTEFQVNSTLPLHQRNPAVAALSNGNFIVVWISEVYRGVASNVDANGRTEVGAGIDVFDVTVDGQIFDAAGLKLGRELKLGSNLQISANPSVAGAGDRITVAWSGKPNRPMTDAERKDSWDVYARIFALDGTPKLPEFRVNSFTYGDQFRPRIAFQDGINFVLWTSLGQDGAWEGVVAKLVSAGGQFMSHEFRVNKTTAAKQLYPTVVANGAHGFLTVWSSFVGGVTSFDLFAQRYVSSAAPGLATPSAPSVSALSQTKLTVTWPELSGFQGVKYEVYVDQSTNPVIVENNSSIIVSLQPDSLHSVRLAYVLTDGRRSALSEAGSGKTWAEDSNYDGLPDDWQARYWPGEPLQWPGGTIDSDGDGATNLQELLAGTIPTDSASVLRAAMVATSQGPRLEWSSEPGCIYQVQMQSAGEGWVSLGTPRFAAGKVDSIPVDAEKSVALYRVIRVR